MGRIDVSRKFDHSISNYVIRNIGSTAKLYSLREQITRLLESEQFDKENDEELTELLKGLRDVLPEW